MRILKSALKFGVILGAIGFAGGFFGPMVFSPESNQGPMLGIFITGPLGFLLGIVIGALSAAFRSPKLPG